MELGSGNRVCATQQAVLFLSLTADFVSKTEPLLQLLDLTYPTKPDAQLCF